MMQDESLGSTISSEAKAYVLIEELEVSARVDVREAREKLTVSIDATIEVRPADMCRRASFVIAGSARKLAKHGVTSICRGPVEVGSVFHLEFDQLTLDLPPILGICDRCVMLDPAAYEVHFQFTRPIELSQAVRDLESPQT